MENRVIVNQRFGHLVTKEYLGVIKHRKTWKLQCDCGKEVIKAETNLFAKDFKGFCTSRCFYLYDITGNRYGRLLVKECVQKEGKRKYKCLCDCGNEVVVLANQLKSGNTKSCGCYKIENAIEKATIHGKSKTPLYMIWNGMKSRCFNKNNKHYKDYGGRGITICKDWCNFENFYNWSVNNNYHKGLSIERIDVNDDYKPENCKWITISEQNENKRNNRLVTYNGETKPLFLLCKEKGLNYKMVLRRLQLGWDIKEAIELPKIPTGCKKKYILGDVKVRTFNG